MNRIIINFCPTGMVPTKEMNPFVPLSVNEIIEETHQAFELGITIVHLHARDENGKPTYCSDIYRKIFEGVRKFCPGLIICGSSSGRNWAEFEKRSAVIELKPDMCSLTPSSLNFANQTSINEPEMIARLALKMKEFGVHPELECFDLGMINYAKYLIQKNIIEGPFYWNLLFGNIAGFQANLNSISSAIQEIPKDHVIALGGLGVNQITVNAIAIAMGLGLRIGLEDNLWWDVHKTIPATNISLLKRIHQLIELHQSKYFKSSELGSLGFYNNKN